MLPSFETIFNRLVAAGSYLTLGTVGIIWFLVSTFVLRKPVEKFLMLNLIQSFILSIIYAIFTLAYNTFIGLLVSLPLVGNLFLKMHIFLFQTPIYNTLSFVNALLILFVAGLAIISLFGKLPRILYITDIVHQLYK